MSKERRRRRAPPKFNVRSGWRGSLSPCCLPTLCLQLHVHSSGQQKRSRGTPGLQRSAATSVWASNNFSAILRRAGISAASSELRDRLRATPTHGNQIHATTPSRQHLTSDPERPSLDFSRLVPVEIKIHKHNHDGTWRRKSWWRRTACAAPAHQLHIQAPSATLGCSDLAVRAGTSISNSLAALAT